MAILIKALQLILSLSILVVFHELGHFVFAKAFKTRVEKFYLFFDPWFSLFKIKRGETEYGIGWLPLGGYVKISGMIDESMDKEQMDKPPQPWEFRSKPAWQRLLIMLGGVMVNFVLAVVIYISILWVWGEEYIPVENVKYGIYADTLAVDMGLQNGDIIIELDGETPSRYGAIIPDILLNDPREMTILRDGERMKLDIPVSLITNIIKKHQFIRLGLPFYADRFSEDSGAKAAGILKGDRLLGINQYDLPLYPQYKQVLLKYKGQEVIAKIERNGELIDIPVTISDEGKIGIFAVSKELFDIAVVKYSFVESVPAGINRGYKEIGDYLKQFKLIFTPETEAYKSVGGFIAIGNIFPSKWDWEVFWTMTALLSIMLGVVNILPIPALDGGHAMFLFFELIIGRKPSDKVMEYAQVAGMLFILTLLVLANGNDIIKLFS